LAADEKALCCLIVSFQTKELLDLCSNKETAEKQLGPIVAQALITMLADIEALDNVSQVMDLYRNDAEICDDGSLVIAIATDCSAVFVPVGANLPDFDHGKPDLLQIQRLKLAKISRRN